MGGPGHEVCHSPETHSVLRGISMSLSPWGSLFGALPPWHCRLSRAVTVGEVKSHKTSWERISLPLYPASVPLGNCIQLLMLFQGLFSFVWSHQADYRHSWAQFCPAAMSSGTVTLSLAHFFQRNDSRHWMCLEPGKATESLLMIW